MHEQDTGKPNREAVHLHAVVRVDRPAESYPQDFVTVKEVLPTREEAEAEAERLNGLVNTDSAVYFAQTTRFYPEGRSVGAPAFRLDEHQAFRAMSLFLDQFAERAGDDLLTLLGDITIESDGGTTDPAAWDDWMRCVEQAKRTAAD